MHYNSFSITGNLQIKKWGTEFFEGSLYNHIKSPFSWSQWLLTADMNPEVQKEKEEEDIALQKIKIK